MRISDSHFSEQVLVPVFPAEIQEAILSFHAYKHTPKKYFDQFFRRGVVSIGNGAWYRNKHETKHSSDPKEGMRIFNIHDKTQPKGFTKGPMGKLAQEMVGIDPDDPDAALYGHANVAAKEIEPCFIYSMITKPNEETQNTFGPTAKITDLRRFKTALDNYMIKTHKLEESVILAVRYVPDSDADNESRQQEHPAYTKDECYSIQSEIRFVWKSDATITSRFKGNIQPLPEIPELAEYLQPIDPQLVIDGRISTTDFAYKQDLKPESHQLTLYHENHLRV